MIRALIEISVFMIAIMVGVFTHAVGLGKYDIVVALLAFFFLSFIVWLRIRENNTEANGED